MSAKRGDVFLLKVGNGATPEVFTTVAGLRPTSMDIDGAPVDVSSKDSLGWRELLPTGAIKKLDIAAGGVYTGGATQISLRALAISGAIQNFQIDDGTDIIECGFQVASYQQAGDHDDAQNFTIALQSSGVPVVSIGS
jgi:predicted secreted protein